MTIRKTLFASAIAASALISAAPAMAQSKLPSPTVAVVDTEKVMTDCTACKAAQAQLQAQLTQMQQYAQQLAAPLNTEANAIDAAIKALPANTQPSAALQTRIQQFQGKQQNAQRLVEEQQATLQRNAQFVRAQIGNKLIPVIDQISKARGASVTIDKGSLLFATPDLDITDGVLAALNQQLTAVNVVAPPQAPQGAAPQGAAPAPAATRPAATGAKPTTPPPGR